MKKIKMSEETKAAVKSFGVSFAVSFVLGMTLGIIDAIASENK